MSTVYSGSTSSGASASSRSSSPPPATGNPHHRRQSLPRTLKLVDGPPVTNRRSLDFASGDQARRSMDGPPRRSTDAPPSHRSMEYQPHRLRALADLRHLPTIPSPIEVPPPHNYSLSDLHEQASTHSDPASSSLFNHQASSLFIDQLSTVSHPGLSTIHDPGPSSTLAHTSAAALITPPSTPTPVGRRKPSISYLPPDSPSHHTRRRSSVVYRPISPSHASWGLSAQPPGFGPPTKHARRRSQLIHGSDVHANSSVDTQYVTDSRPWWSTEAPVSAPILGSFQDAVGPAACTSIDPSPITVTAKPRPSATTSLPLHKQHAELLQSIAQEEARCAELRGQLAVREARLAGLKQRWEDRRAERWGDRASAVEALEQQTDVVPGDTEKVPGEEEMEGDEDEGKDRKSILEETMRKLEGRKVNDSDSDKPGNVVKSEDRFPASSSLSASIRSSFISTTPATDPASPASSSTSSLSSSSSSFGGIREARRWVRSLFVGPTSPPKPTGRQSASASSSDNPAPRPRCTAAQTSYAPPQHRVSMPYASGLSAQPPTYTANGPSAYESGARPSGSVAHSKPDVSVGSGVPAVALDARASGDSNRHWHRRTPSEMTIFAPEEEWIWAWYFVGR
ncbi:hypothetical protein K523DRAFT_417445 [Schizophyllum commune Tattone D]|nr:hypothetical protein K523DRAFT_417445 [Schizophyllum commune Tattone D]